jgi:hypothetical protein
VPLNEADQKVKTQEAAVKSKKAQDEAGKVQKDDVDQIMQAINGLKQKKEAENSKGGERSTWKPEQEAKQIQKAEIARKHEENRTLRLKRTLDRSKRLKYSKR